MKQGMRMKHRIFLCFLFAVFGIGQLMAQGSLCSDIEPFCAGTERLTFPNSNYTNSSQISGEAGPAYGCLEEQPYPAWFFLQVEDTGDLTFRISQYENSDGSGAPLDVDFVVWGPFDRGEEYCNSMSLNEENIVDCSYLPDAVETMTIPNAEANQVYVVLITNFQQLPGFISLEQTNSGGGSTDCSILDSDLGDNIVVCGEDQYVLDGTTDEAEIYEWYVYNENTSTYEQIPGEDGPRLTVTQTGDYRLVVKDLVGASTDQDDVTVTFYDKPTIGEASSLSACVENTEFIDLTQNAEELLAPNVNPPDYEVRYYDTREAAENDEPFTQPQSYPFQVGAVVYARVSQRESGCLSEIEEFELTAFNFPDFQLEETTIFCVNFDSSLLNTVNLGADLGDEYSYEWRDGNNIVGNNAVINFTSFPLGNEITLTLTHEPSGCEKVFTTLPVAVSRPQSVTVEISGSDFGEGYSLDVTATDFIGDIYTQFEYRLDNGNWQESNIFNNVPPGNHVVIVRELNGCGETSSESFFLIGYPRFFTPNSDGYNDTWNLINNGDISIKKLYVFDRYGKLLKQLNPANSNSWDGTYNGKDLPADDYWFKVEFVDEKTGENREYMANFTLIR